MQTSSSRHTVQTSDQVLVAHAANQIARTSLSQDDFAQALSRELHMSIPDRAKEKVVPDFNSPDLTGDVSEFVKFAVTACGDPGTAHRGASATRAAMVLSDMLQRADKRAGELASAYDRARIAGLTCERSYNSLSVRAVAP